jgi:hypothetical protein
MWRTGIKSGISCMLIVLETLYGMSSSNNSECHRACTHEIERLMGYNNVLFCTVMMSRWIKKNIECIVLSIRGL